MGTPFSCPPFLQSGVQRPPTAFFWSPSTSVPPLLPKQKRQYTIYQFLLYCYLICRRVIVSASWFVGELSSYRVIYKSYFRWAGRGYTIGLYLKVSKITDYCSCVDRQTGRRRRRGAWRITGRRDDWIPGPSVPSWFRETAFLDHSLLMIR